MRGKHKGRYRKFVGKGNRDLIERELRGAEEDLWHVTIYADTHSSNDRPDELDHALKSLATIIDVLERQLYALDHKEIQFETVQDGLTKSHAPLWRPVFSDEDEMLYILKRK